MGADCRLKPFQSRAFQPGDLMLGEKDGKWMALIIHWKPR